MLSDAILIPTCDKYKNICSIAIKWLRKYWRNHPPIYICGVKEFAGEEVLSFSVDPRDWIGITQQAIFQLEERGVEYCYLILDDHPPVSRCNELFLNRDLPRKARELDASWISLAGWDQFRPSDGNVLSTKNLSLMHNSVGYKWNLNLHPGLWDVLRLKQLLHEILNEHPAGGSARDFEGIVKTLHYPELMNMKNTLYRISGDFSVFNDRWFKSRINRRIIRYLIHSIRLSAKFLNNSFVGKCDSYLKPYTDYLNGAYPMIWSGLMQNGNANVIAHKFMKLSSNHKFLNNIKDVNVN